MQKNLPNGTGLFQPKLLNFSGAKVEKPFFIDGTKKREKKVQKNFVDLKKVYLCSRF